MNLAERNKRAKLETELGKLDVAERAALDQLTRVGFQFTTIKAARRYLSQIRAVDRYNAEHNLAALEAAFKTPRRKA